MDRLAAARDKAPKIIGSLLVVSCATMQFWLSGGSESERNIPPLLSMFCWVAGTPPMNGLGVILEGMTWGVGPMK